jgi:hypothetical protein
VLTGVGLRVDRSGGWHVVAAADLKLLSKPACAITMDFNATESLAQAGTGSVDLAISSDAGSSPVMLVYWFEFDFSPASSDSFSTSHIGASTQLCWRQNVWYPSAETVHSLTVGEKVSLRWAYAGDRLDWQVLRQKPGCVGSALTVF